MLPAHAPDRSPISLTNPIEAPPPAQRTEPRSPPVRCCASGKALLNYLSASRVRAPGHTRCEAAGPIGRRGARQSGGGFGGFPCVARAAHPQGTGDRGAGRAGAVEQGHRGQAGHLPEDGRGPRAARSVEAGTRLPPAGGGPDRRTERHRGRGSLRSRRPAAPPGPWRRPRVGPGGLSTAARKPRLPWSCRPRRPRGQNADGMSRTFGPRRNGSPGGSGEGASVRTGGSSSLLRGLQTATPGRTAA
jgi:hypothetical protein